MIEPFFFHQGSLFGCYHPASDHVFRRMAIICPPLFDEYRRSYRPLADLANACAEQGVHVLRFDFFGTGESFGMLEEASLERWRQDVEAAIKESLLLTGAEELVLAGVRLGATLAAQSRHPNIHRFVLWDPILEGNHYLLWLNEVNRQFREEHRFTARHLNCRFEDISYDNFHLSNQLCSDLKQLSFDQSNCEQHAETHIITTVRQELEAGNFRNPEYPGIEHNWPPYHDGVLTLKPVLKTLAQRIVQP